MSRLAAGASGTIPRRMATPAPPNPLRRLVDSTPFNGVVFAVILANAVVLGLETFESVDRDHGGTLDTLNDVFLGIFVVELVMRLASYGLRPWNFFRDGWNVFDFIVVTAAFVPGLRENATALRLARLGRVVRIVRLLPDVQILILAIARSLAPLASMTILIAVLLYVYGMVGWALFGDEDPKRWGDIGEAMLTLFVLLTLENLPDVMDAGLEIEPWAWIYFVSFAMIAAFIVLNVLIGVVLNSMEEARELMLERSEREAGREPSRESVELATRLSSLRSSLEELEREVLDHFGQKDRR